MSYESVKESSDNKVITLDSANDGQVQSEENARAIALLHKIKPIYDIFTDEHVEEININQEKELFINYNNRPKERRVVEKFTRKWLEQTGRLIATYSNQALDENNPSITGTLPNGERCQIVIPSGCDAKNIGFSIRKPSKLLFSLDDFEEQGAFESIEIEAEGMTEEQKELLSLYKAKDFKNFLKKAVIYQQNMILSGGTGAGKTTFLKGLAQEIPVDERIVGIEDNRELTVNNPDFLPLLFTKDSKAKSKHTAEECVKWALRLNPDRLLMSELTGAEAQAYLRAVKSGHPGSLTTVHADNCSEALDNIVMMIQNNSLKAPPEQQIRNTLKRTINIVIQYSKIGYNRVVPEIYFDLYEKDRGRF